MNTKKTRKMHGALILVAILACAVYLFGLHQTFFSEKKNQPQTTSPTPAPQSGTEQISSAKEPKTSADTANKTSADTANKVSAGPNSRQTTDLPTKNIDKDFSGKSISELVQLCLSYRGNPSPEAVETLTTLLNHASDAVASTAITTLTAIAAKGHQSEEIFTILKEKAGDMTYFQRGPALLAASQLGKERMLPTVSELVAKQSDISNEAEYQLASRALSVINSPEAVPYIDSLLAKTTGMETRQNCFHTLASIASPEAEAILVEYAMSSTGDDQTGSALALAHGNISEAETVLAAGIREERFESGTVEALASSETAHTIFGQLLNDDGLPDDQKIKLLDILAKRTVTGSGPTRRNVSSAIEPQLGSENPDVQIHAIRAIGQLGHPDTDNMLQPMLVTEDDRVRKEAFYAFLGYAHPSNYTVVYDFLWDSDEKVRRTAMISLERFVNSDDRDILEKAAQHPDEFLRQRAQTLLDQLD